MNIDDNALLQNFELESTTAWSFPTRGNWATHNPKYRGNFAPQIPRNLILNYSNEHDLVLDPMVGSGTTMIECKLLNRNGIAVDINQNAIDLTNKALNFLVENDSKQKITLGDARNLYFIEDNSIDLVVNHPPYLNLVKYSDGNINDISNISNPQKFFIEIEKVAKELYRVLKQDKFCAVLIGDTRKAQHYIPLSYFLLNAFLNTGFILKEEVIKAQHNCTYSKRWEGKAKSYKFYLIMHEHLYIFRKPKIDEDLSKYKWSMANPLV